MALVLLSGFCGCSSLKCKSAWFEGGHNSLHGLHSMRSVLTELVAHEEADAAVAPLRIARSRYDQGEIQADWNSPAGVDDFYAAALWSWCVDTTTDRESAQAQAIHNRSVARLIYEGQLHHRLDPRRGMTVEHAGEQRFVPMEYHGFAWEADDFHELKVVGHYAHSALKRRQTAEGIGVPVVVLRHRSPKAEHTSDFLPTTSAFDATAILKPDGSALALYNPLRTTCLELEGQSIAMARDLTASIAYGLHHHPQSRVTDFLRPNRPNDPARLYFVEPFQPDKIPVVLVHGLLSSPDAWGNILNELRMAPEIVETYQFWAYKYPTGAPFVKSASELRLQLDAVQSRFGCDASNGNLRNAVFIGHSMGGLISKLMVAHSGEEVWNAIANLPLESVATSEEVRARLAERLYFDPHPMASRVVFIATPHRGSSYAGRAIGKLASAMVIQDDPAYEQLLNDNQGGFKEAVSRGLPTSIDLLDPKQPFLDTMNRLRLDPKVPKHSIIGDMTHNLGHAPSDGVVTVESARHAGMESERIVPATHNGTLRSDATVAELKRILRIHAEGGSPNTSPAP